MTCTPALAGLSRPVAVWLALVIAMLGALTPALVQARLLGRGGSADGMQVCSSAGVKVGALKLDAQRGQDSAPVRDHCPLCLPQLERAAPLPQARISGLPSWGKSAPPDLQPRFYGAPGGVLVPPPRGPPAFA